MIVQVVRRGQTDYKTHTVNELGLRKEWKKYAEIAGIEVADDPETLAAEKRRALKAVLEEHGYDDG